MSGFPIKDSIFINSYQYTFDNVSIATTKAEHDTSESFGRENYRYMQGNRDENKVRLYAAQAIKLIVSDADRHSTFVIEEIRYFLWFRREFRQWCILPQKYKFPTDKFPTIEQYIQNPVVAKISWKQIKMLVKVKAIKLKQIKHK